MSDDLDKTKPIEVVWAKPSRTPRRWTQVARPVERGSYRITYESGEMLTYWEGDNGYVFDCAWGVEPGNVNVPSEDFWEKVVPPWLQARRAEVVERLLKDSGHIVKDSNSVQVPGEPWRVRSRSREGTLG